MTRIHVVPRQHGWAVEHEGAAAPLSTHATFEEAERAAKHTARAYPDAEVVLHGREGKIPPPQATESEGPGAGIG
jgi:uncharacterized protein DUF2188